MATRALDIVTVVNALMRLESELGIKVWIPQNSEQRYVQSLMSRFGDRILAITGLESKASREYQVLNQYLVYHKFDPVIDEFDPNLGIAVVSILDKLVHWLGGPGTLVKIRTEDGEKAGFELPASDFNAYYVQGFPGSPLVEIKTQSGDTLWLFVHSEKSIEGIGLAKFSIDVMDSRRTISFSSARGNLIDRAYGSVQIPMVEFDIKPDISWLVGMSADANLHEAYSVTQAIQQFKMRMDETGARVKVATSVTMLRSATIEPGILIINQPFYGWWTQKGLPDLPMAAFFVDWDGMKKPTGKLEEM